MATRKKVEKIAALDRKTESLSIRIDPRLRYALELLSRHQRRAVTGVVEWIIDRTLRDETVTLNGNDASFADAMRHLWHPNELNRIVALALHAPELLTYEESRLWRVIYDSPTFWQGPNRRLNDLMASEMTKHWDKLKPLIVRHAEASVIKPIFLDDIEAAGIPGDVFVPFPF